jgi:phenylalanyl-tRNA synthetase beta chain
MKISYNWLKDYLRIDLSPNRLAEILTEIGLEIEAVEEWEPIKGGMKGIVVEKCLPASNTLMLKSYL